MTSPLWVECSRVLVKECKGLSPVKWWMTNFLLSMSSYICRVSWESSEKFMQQCKIQRKCLFFKAVISEAMLSNWLLWVNSTFSTTYFACASWLEQWMFRVEPWIYRILSDQLRPVIMLEEWRNWASWKEERSSPCTTLRILWKLGNHIRWPSMHGTLDWHLRTIQWNLHADLEGRKEMNMGIAVFYSNVLQWAWLKTVTLVDEMKTGDMNWC